MEDSKVEVAVTNNERSPPPPSFTGRLRLQDFMFNGAGIASASAGVRRSPRISSTPPISSTTATRASTSAAPLHLNPQRSLQRNTASPSPSAKRKLLQDQEQDGSPSTSPTKRPKLSPTKRKSSGYAAPSTYAHLSHLPDALAENLLVLFVGLNPGIQTARTGHAYAHPTNLFWRLLHSSGVTPRLCAAAEDRNMPQLYSLGLTNIVSRPSRNGAELSKSEMDAGVEILEEKVRRWRPESVCVVGKSIWESLWRVRHGRSIKASEFRYGWQDEGENMGVIDGGWKGARVFVATSTSGLAASLKPPEKERIWRGLGGWVDKRRAERKNGEVPTAPGKVGEAA
ncbi:hydrolase-like protein [Apodospora peruviana]|uniref:Hydrolase-like protein n=1 Tax=Apodospora peruviana TaxID=516989 RepID=A0AAE0MEI2_9PEZI|nr:hydrolase-like protein [Apodospora peruviana]